MELEDPMSVLDTPRDVAPEVAVLFREVRRRRRWLSWNLVFLVAAAVTIGVLAATGGPTSPWCWSHDGEEGPGRIAIGRPPSGHHLKGDYSGTESASPEQEIPPG